VRVLRPISAERMIDLRTYPSESAPIRRVHPVRRDGGRARRNAARGAAAVEYALLIAAVIGIAVAAVAGLGSIAGDGPSSLCLVAQTHGIACAGSPGSPEPAPPQTPTATPGPTPTPSPTCPTPHPDPSPTPTPADSPESSESPCPAPPG
jgi:hypothetical protein